MRVLNRLQVLYLTNTTNKRSDSMSSKEGTHTPVSTSSLDIEPGMLVSYRSRAWGEGLVIHVRRRRLQGNPLWREDVAEVLWSGTDKVGVVPVCSLIPCGE